MSLPPTPRRRAPLATAALVAGATLLAFATTGCAIQPPKPWEKGALARPEMTMGGDCSATVSPSHIYTSKENASGGNGVGGGGCGCN
ncbi:DUF4266 domain-containing protein [Mitsuaria sp. TWR114]|uniref:DUF4266 domain-containing protein n=1 Tax=Mitsuaria sp. TWR114 TaxID=2601731 RepID=UPI0011BE67B3|nr:DUF4266 domain-containing protein [Mitsuaria sp. TWR114]TXD88358.1 DUF4266 domain-containing protein [Mitsuaria sp. TWR114]